MRHVHNQQPPDVWDGGSAVPGSPLPFGSSLP